MNVSRMSGALMRSSSRMREYSCFSSSYFCKRSAIVVPGVGTFGSVMKGRILFDMFFSFFFFIQLR